MSPRTDIVGALTRSLAIDRGGFQPVIALRAALGVMLPVLIGTAVGQSTDGVIAAAGALPAGVAGLGGGFRNHSGLIAVTAAGMTLSTFGGGLVAGHTVATLAVLVVSGYVAGLVVVLGREATIVGTQAVLGLVVFGRFPGSVAASAGHAALVFAGGGLQGLLALAFRPPQRYVTERRSLAHAFDVLARLADDASSPGAAAAAAIQATRTALDRRTVTDDTELLRGLVDESGRIRLELQSLGVYPAVPDVALVTSAASGWLRRAAQAVRTGESPPDEDPRLAELVAALRDRRDGSTPGPAGTPTRYAAARAVALLGQLRAVNRSVAAVAGARRLTLPHPRGAAITMSLPGRAAGSVRRVARAGRQPGSAAFRHAIRLAVVLPLAEGLSHALPGHRGYWVALTALVVLKPDYAATTARGLARVAGTLLGVVLVGLVVTLHPSGAAVTVLVGLFAWGAYTGFAASYAIFSFATTGLVVLLVSPTGSNALSTVGDRALDTVVGGALALTAYVVWPTWEGDTLDESMARLLHALADYAELVLRGYVAGAAPPAADLDRAAGAARQARADAQASLERALAEPRRIQRNTRASAGVLAAARRIVIAVHSLRTTLDDTDEHVALPDVERTRAAVQQALCGVAAGDAAAVKGLRDHQQRLEDLARHDATSLRSRRLALVAAHLDPLIDSVDTAAHIIEEWQREGTEPPGSQDAAAG
jgi:uncharacterized membrane protein YccC